ncbi:MAG: hypothetical protein K6E99_03770 [Bacilli bacterium]|nr:hypothetical protein [Bacilli bacterium]
MEKNKKKIKNKEIVFMIIAVLAGALLFFGIWKYYNSTYHCIGCRDTPCSSSFKCDCSPNDEICICNYFDNNGEEKSGLKCPNNNFNKTNNNR